MMFSTWRTHKLDPQEAKDLAITSGADSPQNYPKLSLIPVPTYSVVRDNPSRFGSFTLSSVAHHYQINGQLFLESLPSFVNVTDPISIIINYRGKVPLPAPHFAVMLIPSRHKYTLRLSLQVILASASSNP